MGDVIFLGDVHLSPRGEGSADDFVRFLDSVGPEVARVVILGDLFDLWVGPETSAIEAYREPIEAMRRLTARGIALTLLWGNRDFLLDRRFAAGVGAELAGETVTLDLAGARIHASHGDTFLTRDRGYRVLRFLLRNPLGLRVARGLPFRWSWGIGLWLRRSSTRATARKSPRAFEVAEAPLRALIRRGADFVVCGHVHRYERREVRANGRTGVLLTLEAFGETRAILRWREGTFRVEVP